MANKNDNNIKWESATPYDCEPGYCVIINNMKFEHESLSDLPEGKFDEEHLTKVFTTLGFTVKSHQNLKKIDITSKLKAYADDDHKEKALIVIILSHGGEGDVVYGTDGGEVKLHELQGYFSAAQCSSLRRAPKVFLIDACRGNKSEKGYFENNHKKNGSVSNGCGVITDSLNFATVFASTRGNAAFVYKEGDEKKGSYFTQTLVEVINEADKKKEFNEIITEVRSRILNEAAKLAAGGKRSGQEVKVKGGDEAMAQKPQQDVMTQKKQQEVMERDLEREVETQTVQYNSTLERLYYIKK